MTIADQPQRSMQDWTLRVTRLIDHAARECGRREIVTRWATGAIERTSWGGVAHDARRLAAASASRPPARPRVCRIRIASRRAPV